MTAVARPFGGGAVAVAVGALWDRRGRRAGSAPSRRPRSRRRGAPCSREIVNSASESLARGSLRRCSRTRSFARLRRCSRFTAVSFRTCPRSASVGRGGACDVGTTRSEWAQPFARTARGPAALAGVHNANAREARSAFSETLDRRPQKPSIGVLGHPRRNSPPAQALSCTKSSTRRVSARLWSETGGPVAAEAVGANRRCRAA